MLVKRLAFLLALTTLVFVFGCSTSRHFSVGEKLEKMGRYSDALSAYQAALGQLPADDHKLTSQVYFQMGECMIRLNRIQEAFNAFEKSAIADPNNVNARLRLGEFLLSAGAADRAREQAEAAMRISPRNGEGIALWGAAMEGLGNKEKAKQAYREALETDPGKVSVAVALADLYNHDDQTKEAKSVLEDS